MSGILQGVIASIGAPPVVRIYSDYIILPVNSSNTSPNRIIVYDRVNNSIVGNFSATINSNSRIVRMGNHLIVIDLSGSFRTYNMFTGTQTQTGSTTSGDGDIFKFSETRWGRMSKSGSTNLLTATYSFDDTTGTSTQINTANLNIFLDTQSGFQQQQGGAHITVNSDGILTSYSGYVGGTGLYGWSAPTQVRYKSLAWTTSGTGS